MTPERSASSDEDLIDRFNQALDELRRKQEQLEVAVADFSGAEPEREFQEAWESDDPRERNRAELAHSAFERSHQMLMDLDE